MQKSIFPQKIQKSLCITTKSLYTNSNFKRNYLENYNDSEHAVKTKNAPFFMIFPNISFFHPILLKKFKLLYALRFEPVHFFATIGVLYIDTFILGATLSGNCNPSSKEIFLP